MCDTNAKDLLVRKQLSKIRGQQLGWFSGNNAQNIRTVAESGTAQVGNSYKTSNLPDLYSGAPPNVKNYTNISFICQR